MRKISLCVFTRIFYETVFLFFTKILLLILIIRIRIQSKKF